MHRATITHKNADGVLLPHSFVSEGAVECGTIGVIDLTRLGVAYRNIEVHGSNVRYVATEAAVRVLCNLE